MEILWHFLKDLLQALLFVDFDSGDDEDSGELRDDKSDKKRDKNSDDE